MSRSAIVSKFDRDRQVPHRAGVSGGQSGGQLQLVELAVFALTQRLVQPEQAIRSERCVKPFRARLVS